MTQAKRHYLLASINQRLYAYYFLSRPPKTPTSNINKAGMAATTKIIKIIALPVITFRHSGSISCNARIDNFIFKLKQLGTFSAYPQPIISPKPCQAFADRIINSPPTNQNPAYFKQDRLLILKNNNRQNIVIFTIFCKYLFDEQYQSEKLFAGQENEKLLASRE